MSVTAISTINQRLSQAFDAGNAVAFSIAAADAVVYAEILEQTNERLHDRNKSQEKRIEELRAELLSLRNGEGDDEVTRLEQDLAKLKADYAFSQEQLRESQAEVGTLKEQNQLLHSDISVLTAERDSLQSQLAAMQKGVAMTYAMSLCSSENKDQSANLTEKQLRWFRDDIWAVLSSSPAEVLGLREALLLGKVDGSTYKGECCCLVGTLAHERHCGYDEIPGLTPDSSRPAEVWFYGIKQGDTPERNRLSKLALDWVDQWLANMQAAFAVSQ